MPMLDFTKEIKLERQWKKIYLIAKFFVYLIFIISLIYLTLRVLFPKADFGFFFRAAGALKNTIISPRLEDGGAAAQGKLGKKEKMIFDSAVIGNFSNLKIEIILESGSNPVVNGIISAKKSYQAFFYPLGDPMGFKEGELLKTPDNYYIISGGKRRKFDSPQIAKYLGYNPSSFSDTNEMELQFNGEGKNISDDKNYPEGSLFRVDDDYYQLKNEKLYKFVSARAYLTNYEINQAIQKNPDFLEKYPVADEFLGFADGTLVSYADSAYIISGNKKIPIDSEFTFNSMGYSWDDVIPASGEEIGIYEKTKIFTIFQPQPDGTIFLARNTEDYYYIKGGRKRLIPSVSILKSYLKKSPIIAEKEGLVTKNLCHLEKRFGISKKYFCNMSLEGISLFTGNDYQLTFSNDSDIQIKEISVSFERKLNWPNLKGALSEIKKRLIQKYYGERKN